MKTCPRIPCLVVCSIACAFGLACLFSVRAETPGVTPAPDFTLTRSVYADTISLASYRAMPVLLFFFDGGDVASSFAFPYVSEWDRRYRGDGLAIIGIHCPMFEPLKLDHNIIEVVSRANIKFPVGFDMDRTVYRAYSVQSMPAYVLVKPGGEVVFRTSEVRPYADVEKSIQKLLTELRPGTIHPFVLKPLRSLDDPQARLMAPTPAIAAGCSSEAVEGCDPALLGKSHLYTDSRGRQKGKIYLKGTWKVNDHSILHEQRPGSPDDYVRVVYSGKDVWVLPSFELGAPQRVYIKQDGQYLSPALWGKDVTTVKSKRPYIVMHYSIPAHIVHNAEFGAHQIELIPAEGDVAFYGFFFEGAVQK